MSCRPLNLIPIEEQGQKVKNSDMNMYRATKFIFQENLALRKQNLAIMGQIHYYDSW